MSRHYSADLTADIRRYLDDQDAALRRLPVCDDCGEPITGESYWLIKDSVYCEDCMEAMRRLTVNYV